MILVPTLCVGTHVRDALRPVQRQAPCARDAERPDVRSHAERGDEENEKENP
jgi:hypothetical protein